MKVSILQLYSIMGLNMDYVDEICEDIREQYENGIMTCALFSMTLTPEGDPPVDKAEAMCQKYDLFRSRLEKMGVPNGVLVQASIGHNYHLSKPFAFEPYVKLTDGTRTETVCPYDKGFLEYIRNALRTIASHHPDHIMIDDDLRLMARSAGGCYCSLHEVRMRELTGEAMTRERFHEVLLMKNERAREVELLFAQTQKEAVLGAARAMRDGIDMVDPTLPASFCCVGTNAEYAAEISEILAGKGNPRVVRINNARYTAPGTRFFSKQMFMGRAQIEKLRPYVDVILAETDTCPQNRYSTSAAYLHAQFTASLIEGAKGAKHWITRLPSFEPGSGRAYRQKLSKYRGFYEAIAELEPKLHWRGCRINVTREPEISIDVVNGFQQGVDRMDGWGLCVLERLGIPMYFSPENGGALCMEGDTDARLCDSEVMAALSGTVILASDTAKRLIARGFGEFLGVDVRDWNGETPSYELIVEDMRRTTLQAQICELVPLSSETKSLSVVYHQVEGSDRKPLFPGTTSFRNSIGGTVYVFCGTPQVPYGLGPTFSFLNESRKRQLVRMLTDAGELPIYYPNDEEVYFRAADIEDGRRFCALWNLGADPIERVELVIADTVKNINRLLPDGSLEALDFTVKENLYSLDCTVLTMDPLVLVIE